MSGGRLPHLDMQWLEQLNDRQREAVTHTDGPLLVIAGAGSGKTRVLTYRIAYLLQAGKALPSQILAVTFTNKAAAEMKERLRAIVWPVPQSLSGRTIQATCGQLLRGSADRVGYKRQFVIFDPSDRFAAETGTLK